MQKISKATQRNWDKLGVSNTDGKLVSRANKKLSTKNITPVEYFDNKNNIKTVENIVIKLLASGGSIADILYSVGIGLFKRQGIIASDGKVDNLNIDNFIKSNECRLIEDVCDCDLPSDETDILGIIYQSLLTEGVKNIQGSYYTPKDVIRDMTRDIQTDDSQKVLDPCCGSLAFLLNIPNIKSEQIYAIDIDPIAVMIAKFNYFIKFPGANQPNIFCCDYLNDETEIDGQEFDYVITNPPWGASATNTQNYHEILSGETFSCFLVKAHKSLKKTGQLRFLLPESILNVKVHRDIRDYLLGSADLLSIKMYPDLFSGVTTKYVAIKAKHTGDTSKVEIDIADRTWDVEKNVYRSNSNLVFRLSDSIDESIIEKVLERKRYDLSNSIWALGIVTGNNKDKLLTESAMNLERIYTGKEIAPYKLKPSKYFIDYDRSQLQQVAKDEIYRAKPKLVYKFISKKLVFAIDSSANLFLNSANILVPKIPNMSVNTVAAFLNSELYQYLYIKLFREVKILKGNLIQLPFPEIDETLNIKIDSMVGNIINANTDDKELQDFVYKYYGLTVAEIKCVKKELYGTID